MEKKKNWFRRHWILTSFLIFFILIIILGTFAPEDSSSNNIPNNLSNNISNQDNQQVDETGPAYQKQISEIENKYNINIEYENPPHSSYPGSNVVVLSQDDEEELAKYINLFYIEFNKYPQDFIKNVNLGEVAFVKNLSVDGQYRAAEPDSTNEVLFYDIYLGNYDKEYQQEVVHHEFYHMIEEEINGDPYYKDPVWASFNDPDFEYGSGGALAYDDPEYANKVPESGFISVYSTYGLEEDKAEIFAYLFVPELAEEMYSKAINDPILDKKVKYMKDFISKHSEHMGEDFWQKILIS
ncbi:MAG: putative zinc-binding metallopeptidase [Nanoarchaeota archaeon]|nr:putative zinc-binding metallopeptidase [Nanoarchaeota archaeon]